jgi:thiamine pyrophosphate-dependent acetolactate synthase large subunit-like protein
MTLMAWAYKFCAGPSAQEAEYHVTGDVKDIYPDFVKMAEAFGVPAKRVTRPEELRPALRHGPPHSPLRLAGRCKGIPGVM